MCRARETHVQLLLLLAAILRLPQALSRMPSSHPLVQIASLAAHAPSLLLPPHLLPHLPPARGAETGQGNGGATAVMSGAARTLARRVLAAGCEVLPEESRLCAAYLATAESAAAVKRLAKPLLRRMPNQLSLWLAYAEAEASRGADGAAFPVSTSA